MGALAISTPPWSSNAVMPLVPAKESPYRQSVGRDRGWRAKLIVEKRC